MSTTLLNLTYGRHWRSIYKKLETVIKHVLFCFCQPIIYFVKYQDQDNQTGLNKESVIHISVIFCNIKSMFSEFSQLEARKLLVPLIGALKYYIFRIQS